ncbi:uncharacterized protein LOC118437144 isoform X1 [Folsomia candida]|uniref:uncharacterized protein LOC118437144 isoform X1 n=1 Tax=Folsomia candida TaxID=158441 RepID=UPI001604BE6D|nr:uncharacterized protein LOC118437144 isoform X1 [Folsomia candida]
MLKYRKIQVRYISIFGNLENSISHLYISKYRNIELNSILDTCPSGNCLLIRLFTETVEIEMDTSQAPDLRNYGEEIKQIMTDWFPFVQNLMATSAYKPVRKIRVFFSSKDEGVAWAGGNEIGANAAWLRRTGLKDKGWIVHEMTHILHQARGCPGWIVEGMAEWTRRWHFEPWTHTTKPTWEEKGANSQPEGNGWLVVYLNSVTGKPLIYEMNKACQTGTWHDNWLKERTGKSDKEWWDVMLKDKYYPWQRRA